ncbi:MAG: hypothetical protein WCO45_11605 [Pseudanabaena sp. ELA607]|jgi:septal ring factor EnvC (AmiA/AmiB activator)
MDKLQQQIAELNEQIKLLRQRFDSLPQQVASVVQENYGTPSVHPETHFIAEHKDVLSDKNQSWSSHMNGNEISSEWQIRRLTAQLTTAYNRIAALEEELLNRRMAR